MYNEELQFANIPVSSNPQIKITKSGITADCQEKNSHVIVFFLYLHLFKTKNMLLQSHYLCYGFAIFIIKLIICRHRTRGRISWSNIL